MGDATSRLVLRSRLRADWRGLLALGVLAGLGFGVSFAALATARRTDSADRRFYAHANIYDYSTGYGPDLAGEPMEDIARFTPAIVEHQQIIGFNIVPADFDPAGLPFSFGFWPDRYDMEVPVVDRGRLPSPDAVEEVFLNRHAAEQTGLDVGDRFDVAIADSSFEPRVDTSLHVVGIGRYPNDIVDDPWRQSGILTLSNAFVDTHFELRGWGNLWIGADPDVSITPVTDALASVGAAIDENRRIDRDRADRAVQPVVTAVVLTGLLAMAATWVLLAQALVRRRQRHRLDSEIFRAMGIAPSSLRSADVGVGAILGLLVVAVACVVTVALSPLAPIGPFRDVDPERGPFVDFTVLGVGVAIVVLTTVGLSAIVSAHRTPRAPTGAAPLPLPSLPLPARLGVGWAFESSGSRLQVAGATAGIAVALSLVLSAVVLIGSLDRLTTRPDWYGQLWDVGWRAPYGDISSAEARDVFEHDDQVTGWLGVNFVPGALDDRPVGIIGLDPGRGQSWPLLVDGRAPAAPDEVLVGEETLADAGLAIGDDAMLVGGLAGNTVQELADPWAVTIVGTAIFPNIGYVGIDPPRLGTGVAIAADDLEEHLGHTSSQMVLVDLADGVDPEQYARNHDAPDGGGTPPDWLLDLEPVEVEQASSARPLIWSTVGALALVALGLLAHLMATSVRRNVRSRAVLRALGCTSGQLTSAVVVQTLATYVISIGIAVVAGIALGRAVWRAFADQLEVVAQPTVPPLALLLVVFAGVVGTALVVAPSALRARRLAAPSLLRRE